MFNSNETNLTSMEHSWKAHIKPVADYTLLALLALVMMAIGCEATWKSMWVHIKKPIGLTIGFLSQFALKPLCAHFIIVTTGIKELHAIGILIIASCPGGVLSTIFSYFCDGDMSLSITMTTISSILSIGLIPGNLWLHGRHLETEDFKIPYKEIAMCVASVVAPIFIGMALKWKLPKVAKIIAKAGSCCSFLILFICIVIEFILFPNMFHSVELELYALAILLPSLGLLLGYIFACIFRQNIPIRKTVTMECSVQNMPLAILIVAMSFPRKMQSSIVLLPWLYGFVAITGCSIMCLSYHYFKYRKERLVRNEVLELDLKENGNAREREDLMETNGLKAIIIKGGKKKSTFLRGS